MDNESIVRPTRAQAALELELMEIEADEAETSALYARLRSLNVPKEAVVRLEALASACRRIGGKVIYVGKIILLKLLEFIERHPHMLAGMALGAAVSALIGAIPLLGNLLAPVALALGIAVGAAIGYQLDKGKDLSGSGTILVVTQSAIEIAADFFLLLTETFRAVAGDLMESPA